MRTALLGFAVLIGTVVAYAPTSSAQEFFFQRSVLHNRWPRQQRDSRLLLPHLGAVSCQRERPWQILLRESVLAAAHDRRTGSAAGVSSTVERPRSPATAAALKKAAERIVRLQRRAWSRAANEARNAKLSPERRSEIARKAARARHRYRLGP